MRSVYFREQKRYEQDDLIKRLGCDDKEKGLRLIRRMKEYGVLKAVKKADDPDRRSDLSGLLDDEIELCEVSASDGGCDYIFNFVGIIVVDEYVLRCYPKYITAKDETKNVPRDEMRQVVEVLEQYTRKKEQVLRMLSDVTDLSRSKTNILDLELFFLWDYHENGLYSNVVETIESNGSGEIMWDRTINGTVALFSHNRPIYPDLQTRRRIEDDDDYIRRLHMRILTEIFEDLEDADLLDLFGLEGAEFPDDEEANFGDEDYILYRLDCELNRQFNSRKQLLLKAMRIYIDNETKLPDTDYISTFGTASFNLVWEDVLREIFDRNGDTTRLREYIGHPHWTKSEDAFSDTFIPDIVCLRGGKLLILDAKYYTPTFEYGVIKGMPGIESISKQYLYQMAFEDYVRKHDLPVENCFILPTEKDKVGDGDDRGEIRLDILSKYCPNDVKVRFLPATEVYRCYLDGREFPVDELKLDEDNSEGKKGTEIA